jgi:hypothetical protein
MVELCLHAPTRLHDLMLNYLSLGMIILCLPLHTGRDEGPQAVGRIVEDGMKLL